MIPSETFHCVSIMGCNNMCFSLLEENCSLESVRFFVTEHCYQEEKLFWRLNRTSII